MSMLSAIIPLVAHCHHNGPPPSAEFLVVAGIFVYVILGFMAWAIISDARNNHPRYPEPPFSVYERLKVIFWPITMIFCGIPRLIKGFFVWLLRG